MSVSKKVNIKIFGDWYEAVMEIEPLYTRYPNGDMLLIRKYNLRENLKKIENGTFHEVECSDGHKSDCYICDARTLIEKEGHPVETLESTQILIEKTIYDAEADTTFEQTYLFNKNHAKVVFQKTTPMISDFRFFLAGKKDAVTSTLWLTANGGFVLETGYSSGDTRYNILEKYEAEEMVKEYSKDKYIEIFHPQEI